MNADRRKKLDALRCMLGNAQTELEAIRSDEQDAYDNLPESLQSGDRGEAMQAGIDALEEAGGCLENAVDLIREAVAS